MSFGLPWRLVASTDRDDDIYRVYFEDGPLAGQEKWVRYLRPYVVEVMDAGLRGRPAPTTASVLQGRRLTYEITHQQHTAGPYLWKDAFVAECGEPGPLDSRNNFRKYLAGQPWRKSQPAGSRDFEGWWAMRMLELGRASLDQAPTWNNWMAVEWRAQMERFNWH